MEMGFHFVEVDEVKTYFHVRLLNVLLPNRVRRVG